LSHFTWQLPVLPSVPYCRSTPTESSPCLGKPWSSTTQADSGFNSAIIRSLQARPDFQPLPRTLPEPPQKPRAFCRTPPRSTRSRVLTWQFFSNTSGITRDPRIPAARRFGLLPRRSSSGVDRRRKNSILPPKNQWIRRGGRYLESLAGVGGLQSGSPKPTGGPRVGILSYC